MGSKYKDALEDMVWQFAYRRGGPYLSTGGLSALEHGFEVLGWEDPHEVADGDHLCDVEGCYNFTVAQGGMWAETGYWMLCDEHSAEYRQGELQPKMKERSIKREASRGEDGCLPMPKRK